MKTTDIAFTLTLGAMLLGSLAAVGSLGLRTGSTGADVPVLWLEPVVITGTKGPARARAATSTLAAPCPAQPQKV